MAAPSLFVPFAKYSTFVVFSTRPLKNALVGAYSSPWVATVRCNGIAAGCRSLYGFSLAPWSPPVTVSLRALLGCGALELAFTWDFSTNYVEERSNLCTHSLGGGGVLSADRCASFKSSKAYSVKHYIAFGDTSVHQFSMQSINVSDCTLFGPFASCVSSCANRSEIDIEVTSELALLTAFIESLLSTSIDFRVSNTNHIMAVRAIDWVWHMAGIVTPVQLPAVQPSVVSCCSSSIGSRPAASSVGSQDAESHDTNLLTCSQAPSNPTVCPAGEFVTGLGPSQSRHPCNATNTSAGLKPCQDSLLGPILASAVFAENCRSSTIPKSSCLSLLNVAEQAIHFTVLQPKVLLPQLDQLALR